MNGRSRMIMDPGIHTMPGRRDGARRVFTDQGGGVLNIMHGRSRMTYYSK